MEVAEQTDGEGTGAAVLAARDSPGRRDERRGDPLRRPSARIGRAPHGLLEPSTTRGAAATLLTTDELDPAGYGRIVRDGDGSVERIVETKDPDGVPPDELAIREINLGTYVFDAPAAVRRARRGRPRRTASATSPASFPILRDRGRAHRRSPDRRRSTAPSASTTAPT